MSSDPTTWGIQVNGWVTPTAAEILERLELDEKGNVNPNVDVDADAALGQVNGVFAAQLGQAWEAMGALEASRSRDGAEGAMLDEIGKLTGTARDEARPTTATCNVVLEAGTTLTTSHRASVVGHPELTFYPVVDENVGYTAAANGTYSLVFACTVVGSITVAPNSLTVIVTPVSGWTSVTNPSQGTNGSAVATDEEARIEQEIDLATTGSATTVAIAAELAYDSGAGTGVPGVISAIVFENTSDVTDVNLVPPHSIECLLYTDGTEVAADVAEAIWKAKPAGCGTYGEHPVVYTDDFGEQHSIRYSTVNGMPMYLVYHLTIGTGYIGDTALKAALAAALTANAVISETVYASRTKAAVLQYSGVLDVTQLQLGVAPNPTNEGNIPTILRAIATYDVSRIQLITTT